MIEGRSPRVFISYSWDDDNHREWVRDFAARLRGDGIDIVLDRWQVAPGDQLPEFMERSVRESDFVLCICTPQYKEKSDRRGSGVGYEGDIMTGEVFANRNQRKFIPVLRKGEWRTAAPSWWLGKYYIDLRGESYSEQNYEDLLSALLGNREEAPGIGSSPKKSIEVDKDFEFVNREIELATFDLAKFPDSYWQCALIDGPTGYGKSRFLERLIKNIQENPDLRENWNYCCVDLADCDDPDNSVDYIANRITGEMVTSDVDEQKLKNTICTYILEKMSMPSREGSLRNILFIVDSIDCLATRATTWFFSVIHDLIVGSYIDYEQGDVVFNVRVIISGVDTETFWRDYLSWEISSKEKYRLLPPKKLSLSAFDDLAVRDLIKSRAKKEGIALSPTKSIPDISYELQYLSGGHPQVVSEILRELVAKKFLQYKKYLSENRERLIGKHVSKVAKKIIQRFPLPQAQKDIKTICVFRLIDLNTLQKLLAEQLVSSQIDISLLGLLCQSKILTPPNAEKLFYHDDIIRRILYLDLAFRNAEDREHVQKTHKCAKAHYDELIRVNHEQHSFHYFFVEWLFHTLQITDLTNEVITTEWKSILSLTRPTFVSLDDLKRAIREKLETDSEVKYLYRERFGTEDFSPLFEL